MMQTNPIVIGGNSLKNVKNYPNILYYWDVLSEAYSLNFTPPQKINLEKIKADKLITLQKKFNFSPHMKHSFLRLNVVLLMSCVSCAYVHIECENKVETRKLEWTILLNN